MCYFTTVIDNLSIEKHVYEKLADKLRNQIIGRELKGKIPGIRELADRHSINFKTVNKAISLLVSEGLLYRLKGKGTYVVDTHSPVDGTRHIGVLLLTFINPYFARLVQALQHIGMSGDASFHVNTTDSHPDYLQKTILLYKKRGIQAIILQGHGIKKEKHLSLIMNTDIPVIGSDTYLTDIDDVQPDVQAGAQMAVDHLLDTFGGSVAYVCGSHLPITQTERYRGYRDALLSKGIREDYQLIKQSAPTYKGGYEAVKQIIERGIQPRSFFLHNQAMAMGALSAITALGMKVPEDIALAGCDDSVDVEEMLVPITSIAFSFEETAAQILMLVDRRIKNPSVKPMCVRIAPKLIIRESSTPQRT